jgi:AraC-like DNA-binding protein
MQTPDRKQPFRHIQPGFERIAPGFCRPRHCHFSSYVTILLEGTFEQASYAGRMRLESGDVLIQPTLDRHESRTRPRCGLHLLRLAWHSDWTLGGVYKVPAVDRVIRTAERNPRAASELLMDLLDGAKCEPAKPHDWPDLLAAQLRKGETQIATWAEEQGLARETVSRGFAKTYGVPPRAFATELKAREAWIRTITRSDSLAIIAAELGYADQPHMTRAVRALTGAPPDAWRKYLASSWSAPIEQRDIANAPT